MTGASGYIGGALVPFLAGRGYDLRLLDNRSGPVEATHREWPVERSDFESDRGLALLSDCDVILHLAAVSGVVVCARDPVGSSRTNVGGTGKLIEMCRERRIAFAFASSFAVVGSPRELPVIESTSARPTHEYARQKAAGEELTRRLTDEGKISAAIVRQSNVYGGYHVEGRRVAKGNVIELFARQAPSGRLTVNAPGTQRRDFIHVQDVVAHWEAVVRFLVRPEKLPAPSTFNVASGESLSVAEVAEKVARCFHELNPGTVPVKVEVVPNPREGIELVEPQFAVSRALTERLLEVRCRETVDSALPAILREAAPKATADASPRKPRT